MAEALFPFFALMAAGYICRYVPGFPAVDLARRVLTLSTLWFFLPALIVRVLSKAVPNSSYFVVSAVAIGGVLICLLACAGIYGIISLIFKEQSRKILTPEVRGVLLLGASWGNITFLGLPLLTMFYGADTAHIAMLYDVFGIGPLLYTLGAIIAASHSALSVSQHAKAEKLKAGLFLFLKTPPLWAAALGLGLSLLQIPLPALLDHSFDIMGRAVTPVMVFSVGLALQLPRTKRDWMFLPWLLPAAFVKLVVAPFVAMLLVALSEKIMITGLVPLEKKALVLEAGMSTMVVTLVVSDLFGLDTKTCARLIALTTLLSFITIPIFA